MNSNPPFPAFYIVESDFYYNIESFIKMDYK